MKRLIASVLLSTALLQAGGWMLFIKVHKHLQFLRFESNQSNCRQLISFLNLSTKEYLAAGLDEDELVWQNNRYDVLEKVVHGDVVVLKVLYDEKETSLMDRLNDWAGREDNVPSSNHFLKLLSCIGTIPENAKIVFNKVSSTKWPDLQSGRCVFRESGVLVPPPETV